VKAAVQLEEGFAPSPALEREILAHARARIAGYKVPRSIDFERELPRTAAGKLAVRRLRERYWQREGRRI
jgi:acyl-coenzyme A synthetase/AMP-(fatty) acid ligase